MDSNFFFNTADSDWEILLLQDANMEELFENFDMSMEQLRVRYKKLTVFVSKDKQIVTSIRCLPQSIINVLHLNVELCMLSDTGIVAVVATNRYQKEVYDGIIIFTFGVELERLLRLAFLAVKPNSAVKVIVRNIDEAKILREIKLAGFVDPVKPNISVGAAVPLTLPHSSKNRMFGT
ncbi:Fe-S cluster assembly protein DRE2 [Dirofilaria immitis]|nr:Fe-S cluster assembly protein DRE2 [Dirofilaria immitis]